MYRVVVKSCLTQNLKAVRKIAQDIIVDLRPDIADGGRYQKGHRQEYHQGLILRNDLAKCEAECHVLKNRLIRKVAEANGMDSLALRYWLESSGISSM